MAKSCRSLGEEGVCLGHQGKAKANARSVPCARAAFAAGLGAWTMLTVMAWGLGLSWLECLGWRHSIGEQWARFNDPRRLLPERTVSLPILQSRSALEEPTRSVLGIASELLDRVEFRNICNILSGHAFAQALGTRGPLRRWGRTGESTSKLA